MMNIRFSSVLLAMALTGLVGCRDSGHSLGNSRDLDAGTGDTPVGAGGSTGSSAASSVGAAGSTGSGGASLASSKSGGISGGSAGSSSTSTGGATGGSGGQSASSTAKDAGVGSDTAVGTCSDRGESCASRPCCGPLVCMNLTNPPSCAESYPPPADAGLSQDTRVTSDSQCPVCDPMKCAYGSPVDSNGCTICKCNPAPDGGPDTSRCPAGGCLDADLSTPCPAQPPTEGSPCLGQNVCNYEDCPGTGYAQASCRSNKWVVPKGACGTVTCLGIGAAAGTCPEGKVCLVKAGGALLVECIDNPCGSGLVSADCSTVTVGCTPILSTSAGLTFYCNTCPSGTCA